MQMMTADEAFRYLKLKSVNSLYDHARRGRVPCVKVGRRMLFSKECLDDWVKEQSGASIATDQNQPKQYGVLRAIF